MTGFHNLSAFMSRSGRRLADLLWPPSCIGCGAAVIEPDGVCAACWQSLPHITAPFCARYGVPLPFDLGTEAVSARAITDPPVFRQARGAFLYQGLARDLVHRLKYNDRTELARPMARAMALAGRDLLAEATGLVPVPLHRFRFLGRRYNQAALLARELGRGHDLRVYSECLTRVKSTRPQVGLTRSERAENLAGAFKLVPSERLQVAGQRLLLIDDVMTSAATGNAAARVLMKAGATSVDLLVFAVVANF